MAESAVSSRQDASGAGWNCARPGSYVKLMVGRCRPVSWFDPRVLWKCRNDFLDRRSDPVPDKRAAWVAGLTPDDFSIDLTDRGDSVSFLLLGDTGEGDHAQYAVIPPLQRHAADTEFLFICSDVLYPIGDVNDYANKFYRPYSHYDGPIYAVPGNHDWYDDLFAFMYHFCGRNEMPKGSDSALRRQPLFGLLWRRPARPNTAAIEKMRALRSQPAQTQVQQRSPYFTIDTAQLRLVAIDTGIKGNLDAAQGRWLLRVSEDPRPKVLLTGKPLLVDGRTDPCSILDPPDGYPTVLDIVHDPRFRYVASIGGDIHNYQRYPVRLGNRTVQHVVSGGGGAFMHATHLIPRIDPSQVLGVSEEEFRCYPLRRDSLAAYSRVLQGILRRLHIPLTVEISPDEAAAFLQRRLQVAPLATRPADDVPRLTGYRLAAAEYLVLFGSHGFHKWFSPLYDWDTPPFFKQFLRVDVSAGAAHVTCYGVSGCGDAEDDPPVEDKFTLGW